MFGKNSEPQLFPTGQIFTNHVKFKVDAVAWLYLLQVGVFIGVGNDGHGKPVVDQIECCKADAIDADAPFFNEQMSKLSWILEGVEPAPVLVFHSGANGSSVNVALHQVSIQPAVHGYTTFQVYDAAFLPLAQVGFRQGFGNGSHLVTTFFHLFHREAYAAVTYALVHFQLARQTTADQKTAIGARVENIQYHPGLLYYSCKHDLLKVALTTKLGQLVGWK